MQINIRKATVKDFPEILKLIKELATYEKAPEKVTNSVAQMLAEKDLFECFVAETPNKEIVGFALYFFAYYTWVGKSLYLDDLYVQKNYRGMGIGRKLLQEVLKVAKQENCKRIRWQVLNWNTPAIEFYKRLGVTLDDEWINCDLTGEELAKTL